jgi:hypothetical protein
MKLRRRRSKPIGIALWRPGILARLEALLRRVKTLRRQVYGENYDLDIWREVELELEAIISDLLEI